MQKNTLETIVGFLVLLVAALFFYDAYKITQLSYGHEGGYNVKAKFEKVDGLNVGGDVKIGGIKIGKVLAMDLDPRTYQAITTFKLKKEVKIPVDSTAIVTSDSFLGGKYVSITPGAETSYLKNNDTMEFTQSPVNLESLLGKFIFNSSTAQQQQKPKE